MLAGNVEERLPIPLLLLAIYPHDAVEEGSSSPTVPPPGCKPPGLLLDSHSNLVGCVLEVIAAFTGLF